MRGIENTSTTSFGSLLRSGSKYKVPLFQRDYSWNEEQWDDLWQDIQSMVSEGTDHYMGYLVLQSIEKQKINLISRFIYGFSCGRLTTRKYIIQFLPESEIKFYSLVYILIIYSGMLTGVLVNFKLKDTKPLFIWSFYIDKYASIFALGAIASLLYLILIFIFFTEPTKASMLNQIRTELNQKSNEKIEEEEDSINEGKDVYDYKESYDENETKDDSNKVFNYIFRGSGSSNGRNTTNKAGYEYFK